MREIVGQQSTLKNQMSQIKDEFRDEAQNAQQRATNEAKERKAYAETLEAKMAAEAEARAAAQAEAERARAEAEAEAQAVRT